MRRFPSVRREHTVSEGLHLQQEDKVGGVRKSLHYKEFHIYSTRTKNVPYEKGRIYGMRRRLCRMRKKSTV